MADTIETKKRNWIFIIGVLIMCVGMQVANYGTAVCLSGEMNSMGATDFYVLVNAFGSLGMMLILPMVGKFTAMFGLRNMITAGIIVQLAGRVLMIFSGAWVPYAIGYLIQSVGGGFYVSSAYVNMGSAVEPQERAKFFGYIAVANAIGAIFGPMMVSSMYAAGGLAADLAYIINLPITVIGFILMFKHCSNQKTPGAGKGFDYLGVVLTAVGIACLVLWLNLGGKASSGGFDWLSAPSIIMIAVAVVMLGVLFKRESSIANPAVPIKMFKNKRLTYAFIGAIVAAAYSTCSASYSIMWIRINYSSFPGATLFNGTASLPQQVVIVMLGLFLGAYIGKKFVTRFRPFGILSMLAAMIATGILFCLQFTGTAAEGNIHDHRRHPCWYDYDLGGRGHRRLHLFGVPVHLLRILAVQHTPGGHSLWPGSLQFWLHRRLVHLWGRGRRSAGDQRRLQPRLCHWLYLCCNWPDLCHCRLPVLQRRGGSGWREAIRCGTDLS